MKKLLVLIALLSLFACAKAPIDTPQYPHFDGYVGLDMQAYIKAGFEPVIPSRIADIHTYTLSWYNGMMAEDIKANASHYIIFITDAEYIQYKLRTTPSKP